MPIDMEKLVSLCKRRGFIFQSSEIYGGINGFWDYGPLGVELKRNIKDAWWQDMVRNPPPGPDGDEFAMVGVDCSIIMNPKVWVASGHVGGFSDPMVDCKKCKRRFRADKVYVFDFVNDAGEMLDFALSYEANDHRGATELLEVDKERLVKKNRIPPGYWARIWTASTAPSSLRRPCPAPDCDGELTDPRQFNLMFKTFVGAVEDPSAAAWLRPETAQGIFANFKNVSDSTRLKLPFGIAQVGKAFRNEINPRNYTFRSREFEQMEIEFFCKPSESMKWYEFWRDLRKAWYSRLGIKSDNLRPREQGKEELAFYSIGTTDIEYMFPFSEEPQELEGVAHRGNYDLTQHENASGKDMHYFDDEAWERDKSSRGTNSFREWLKSNPAKDEIEKYQFLPHVIEPSAGADRFTLAVLCEAFAEEEVNGETRTVMKFHPRLAPIKAAVFPLVNKEGMPEIAYKLYRELKAEWNVQYDDKGAVGRRYRRQDEAGTPYCLTVDGQTLQDQTVTVRDRDTLAQERVAIKEVGNLIRERLRS